MSFIQSVFSEICDTYDYHYTVFTRILIGENEPKTCTNRRETMVNVIYMYGLPITLKIHRLDCVISSKDPHTRL